MIPQNCEILASVLFLFFTKIVGALVEAYRGSMFNKSGSVLTSIPEKNEEEEISKWVPKKKHEVLKAKYKCLKKLFQIYDASVIAVLPEPLEAYEEEPAVGSRRRKRSNRTKTDACAGTTEVSSEDFTQVSETEKDSTIATAVMRDLQMPKHSRTSTQFEGTVTNTVTNSKYDRHTTTQNSKSDITEQDYRESEVIQSPVPITHPLPYLIMNERPKLTRFQWFMQRIFGIRQERYYKCVNSDGHVYAASDNNIMTPRYERRRRKGLRFRNLRNLHRIQSESALANVKSPMILTCVQSVQKNCLKDTTPRQCPIVGCRMIFYGIINYNDHLNLSHFVERKFVCHYCHEGFEGENEKYLHENEHIGINKLSVPIASASKPRKASITQTEPESPRNVPEDKLRRIVSFFDKITNPEQIMSEINKKRYSETSLQAMQRPNDSTGTETSSSDSDKRTVSCVSLHRRKKNRGSDVTAEVSSGDPVRCKFCGEQFDYRRQLSLHVDLEHRVHDKFSKFHSCAGITNTRRLGAPTLPTEQPKLDLNPSDRSAKTPERRRSAESLAESTPNVVYYTSSESVKSRVPKAYKWEPGTKIIRV